MINIIVAPAVATGIAMIPRNRSFLEIFMFDVVLSLYSKIPCLKRNNMRYTNASDIFVLDGHIKYMDLRMDYSVVLNGSW